MLGCLFLTIYKLYESVMLKKTVVFDVFVDHFIIYFSDILKNNHAIVLIIKSYSQILIDNS